ncbi:hypothetical protein OAN307_c26440 [Octadecabacter antarcticus 307]|uniref:Uncharacterized protein n=1 Tax=Octadecabacter antarcticus 307 TaxID=391626 RepID=M9R8W0_9RHOB|nr:hypothetical protein [Octadecabacter antarcticus]AGI68233.1 hypothetical protein OAN307_c26440 [Octadecabacter antarcticus 307]
MVNSTNGTPRQRYMNSKQRATLTSPEPLLRPGPGAPSAANLKGTIATLYRAAAATEMSDEYADRLAKGCLGHGQRLDLLRATLVLVFKNADADTVWDAGEYILVPLLIGLCEGQHETGNVIGTGMGGSDGREHLLELTRDEGEPLQRIIEAIARHCPQILYGHPESSNE